MLFLTDANQQQRFTMRSTALLFTIILAAAPSANATASAISPPSHDATIRLGLLLFNDTDLSADGRISCAQCHQPDHAFSDSKPLAQGTHGMKGTRNAPSLLNAADRTALFWDGRRSSLEELMLDPLLGPREHGLRDADELASRIEGDRAMRAAYAVAFGSRAPLSAKNIARSLAAYVSTLRTSESPFDRYASGKDS
jgi:cytochrome c peroxidase